jgi:predicted nucleic acid-binding protein
MRVFLDANVLFSASLARSRMRAFLDVLFQHGECLTSDYATEEARRNLELKSPGALPCLDALVARCELVRGITTQVGVELKDKDIPILGGAIAGRATHLLTGDERDFGALFGKTVRGVIIVSPRMLAEELARQGLF